MTTNYVLYDTTYIQKVSMENSMGILGYRFDKYSNVFYNPENPAAEIVSFYTAVRLHNCHWIRVSDYEWVPEFHFNLFSANKSPFKINTYQWNLFQAAKIVETVHLQKTKHNILRPVQHLVKFVDEDYYPVMKEYFGDEVVQ